MYKQALKEVKWFPFFALGSVYFHKISVYCTNYNSVHFLGKGEIFVFILSNDKYVLEIGENTGYIFNICSDF